MRKSWRLLQGVIILFLVAGSGLVPVKGQSTDTKRPIDMMIVIDNSCSMFPSNKILAGCDAYGGDPNQIRITGADLFIARLGFGEQNEADYNLGIISMGDKPVLVSPLGNVSKNRDSLAAKIATPQPSAATKIIPALQMAYDALKTSSQGSSPHLPAILMISDGVPWPTEGQSNDDLEKLVSAHKDIPIFMMLLRNPSINSADFENYINFWQKLQGQYPFVFTYLISDAGQIQETYNQILGQLQNSIPASEVTLAKNEKSTFIVGDYINKVIITSVRKTAQSTAALTITDPNGKKLDIKDAGVTYFRGKTNPIEVYSIGTPRLTDSLRGSAWTVTASDDVTLMIDRMGSYHFDFIDPAASYTGLGTYYNAQDKLFSNKGTTIRFQLSDEDAKAVLDPQQIQLSISNQAGKSIDLPLSTLRPDGKGVYELPIDLTTLFPSSNDPSGRYVFSFKAGQSEIVSNDIVAIATATLTVELGKVPTIRTIVPLPISCSTGESTSLQVSLKDIDTAIQDLLAVRVIYGDQSMSLKPASNGQFSGDISELCQTIILKSACSTVSTTSMQVEVVGNSPSLVLPKISRTVDVNIIALTCTSTPLPTITPTPTPTPTPVPDMDLDGVNDLVDRCPSQWGWPQDSGCIPWYPLLGGGGAIVFFGLIGVWFWPWMKATRISPAPKVYLAVYRDGVRSGDPIAIDQVSRKRRVTRLIIGGSQRKADIHVEGLLPIEYLVEWWGGIASLRGPADKEPFAYFDQVPRMIRTSDPKVTLKIGTELGKI
jgi:hypothetical protein